MLNAEHGWHGYANARLRDRSSRSTNPLKAVLRAGSRVARGGRPPARSARTVAPHESARAPVGCPATGPAWGPLEGPLTVSEAGVKRCANHLNQERRL